MAFWRKLGWWLVDIPVDLYAWLLTLWYIRPPAAYAKGDSRKPAVVILPGKAWGYLKPLADRLAGAGYRIVIVPAIGRNTRPVKKTAERIASYLAERQLQPVAFLGHSKGGLVGKYLLAHPEMAPAASGVIAIGTPWSGAKLAALMPIEQYRELLPGSILLQELDAMEEVNRRIVSIAPSFDNLVSQASMYLPGARNIRLKIGGHHAVLYSKKCAAAVLEALSQIENKNPT
jgi:pimeloyl-ACP methyl ester carboxylesterase